MSATRSTREHCKFLLSQWRKNLVLTRFETSQLAGELKALDQQLERLREKRLRLSVFGKVGVGKSSLLNALLGQEIFATDVAHGCTRVTKAQRWDHPIANLNGVDLVDTPGIDEIASPARERLAARVALHSDLVLLVIDSDLTNIELKAVETLLKSGKPILIALNRCDQWDMHERIALVKSIQNRLPTNASKLKIQMVAAAPRQVCLQENGRIRSEQCTPMVESLREYLVTFLSSQGELLLSLNSLKRADHFYKSLKCCRFLRNKKEAQGLIGRFAALKASGVAANPLLILDLAGGLACDTALVMQLSKLYGLHIGGHAARQLIKKISLYNAYLGGAQLGIQVALGALRQVLVIAAPWTGGVSLASAAPVALTQAALAVQTTKITGRLAAKELLQSSQRRNAQPSAIFRVIANNDPQMKKWLKSSPEVSNPTQIQTLLP